MGPRMVLVVAAALGLVSGVAVVALALRGPEPGPAVVEARVRAVEHGERADHDDEEDHEQRHAHMVSDLLYQGKSSYS